jgi:hypothetical protein
MKKDSLKELIDAFSPSEKRHFTIYSKGHVKGSGNNYALLFNAINSSKANYSEELHTKLPKNYPFKNLHVEKNYLYNLLLKSLNDFHSDITAESTIDKINKHIELLLNKGLHSQCLTLIKKAKKIGFATHAESQLIRTLELEQEIYNKLQDYKKLLDSIDESRTLLRHLLNQYDYKNLAFEMNYKEITFRSTNKTEQLNQLQLIMQNELMQNETLAKTYKAKMFLYQTKAMFYGIVNDEHKSIYYFEQMMRLMEANPSIIKQEAIDYLLVFANVAMGKINIKNYKELLNDIAFIEKMPEQFGIKKSNAFEANLFFFTKPYLLDVFTALGDKHQSQLTILEIEKHIENYKNHVILTAYLNTAKSIAIASFYLADFKKALKYMNLIFSDDLGKYSRGQIFNMIIHYELGNEQLLISLINSTKRLLTQQDRLNKAEELMIEFFSKLIKLTKNEAIKKHFIDYHKKALELINDEDANISLRYFNVFKWMESKIQDVPLVKP